MNVIVYSEFEGDLNSDEILEVYPKEFVYALRQCEDADFFGGTASLTPGTTYIDGQRFFKSIQLDFIPPQGAPVTGLEMLGGAIERDIWGWDHFPSVSSYMVDVRRNILMVGVDEA